MLGGGWNFLNLSGPDAPVAAMSLVGRVIVPWLETDRELFFPIHLEHADGKGIPVVLPQFRLVLRASPRPSQPESIETATPFVVDFFGLAFPRPGEYAFVMMHEEEEVARTRFQVNFTGRDAPELPEPAATAMRS